MNRHQRRRALTILQHDVYPKVPNVACKGLCVDQCTAIAMTEAEFARLEAVAGRPPGVDVNGTCSLLKDGRCSAYRDRPLICRIYGTSEAIACPHGCVPERTLTQAQAGALITESMRIGGPPKYDASVEAYLDARGLGHVLDNIRPK